jgi:5-methylcytosine-specific restriction protein B
MEWVADVVERANDRLREDRHAAIGPSYFMKDDLDEAAVERIWRHSVLPYIEERLYGQQEEVDKFKLDGLIREVAGEIATTAMASDVSGR